jgi:hypothetical protein
VHVAAPASSPPTADDALTRMHATFACGNAIQAEAKIDHFGGQGRVRADLMLFAARPAELRMDVFSPFGVTLATLTSDGRRFALADLRDKSFYFGPASACNIARLTTLPVPGHVLVDLLRGEAPVLRHTPAGTTMTWDDHGYWVVGIEGNNQSHEEIHLAPRPDDLGKPWSEQRVRVLDVRVVQQGYVLYHAELSDQKPAPTAGPRLDPDHIDPPIPPSGPTCDAEVPRKIRMEIPEPGADVRFSYGDIKWNPPLPAGVFEQQPQAGMRQAPVDCAQ